MKIAFHTANYFARASNYKTTIEDWGNAERKVIENFCLAEFNRICQDISNAGFNYIELWMGYASPKFITPYFADELKSTWKQHNIEVISYSCSLGDPVRFPKWTRLCFETSKMLGINMITSGITAESVPAIYGYCREYDIAVENHPEKHPDEILAVIGDYGDLIGARVDTGWFATQGYQAHEALNHLKDYLFYVHLKDVKEVDQHRTTELNKGIIDVNSCINVLKVHNYIGFLSIENEAADRNPTNECIASANLVRQLIG